MVRGIAPAASVPRHEILVTHYQPHPLHYVRARTASTFSLDGRNREVGGPRTGAPSWAQGLRRIKKEWHQSQ